MEKMHFETRIQAPAEKVWKTLFEDATYRQWTSVFYPGSYAESDWKEGSKILFLSPEKNGMASRIKTMQPYKFLSFEHLGEVKNGVEDYESESVKAWTGGTENYTLQENDGVTHLSIDMDVAGDDFKTYFEKTWPNALQKVKELAEGGVEG